MTGTGKEMEETRKRGTDRGTPLVLVNDLF